MGYGGKVHERRRARELRAQSWTLAEIAAELGVSKSSASLWTRDVEFVPKPRNRGHASQRPHPLHVRKLEEIERCRDEAAEFAGSLTRRDLYIYGLALYEGEGFKTVQSRLGMANTSPLVMSIFVRWLREFFDIDETRLRARLYLHSGLDLDGATAFWSDLLAIPVEQFGAPYRALQRGGHRTAKHVRGCLSVRYSDVRLWRRVMALNEAIGSRLASPG